MDRSAGRCVGFRDLAGTGTLTPPSKPGWRRHLLQVWRVSIDTSFLRRCIGALERAFVEVGEHHSSEAYLSDIFRAACVKEFELVLEQSGKLLRKRLADFFASNRQADRLAFRNLFRHGARHGLIEADAAERWLRYRDNRNSTVHDYDENFAEATLKLLPAFIADARALADMIEASND